jgi:hypothetical protein
MSPGCSASVATMRIDRATIVGLGVVVVAMAIYWLSNRGLPSNRGDYFYLADAFLHGRTWLDFQPGPADIITIGSRVYIPFAPFPAIAFVPLVALVGSQAAVEWQSGINAALAAVDLGLGWLLLSRIGVRSMVDRVWLVVLLGFSTQLWWVTILGGVWHTGHIVATMLTLACLIELWGKRRAVVIGLLAGAAFLTRAPLALAVPFYALLLAGDTLWEPATWPWRRWGALAAGVLPAIAFFFWYNVARFGSPIESGYTFATLPPFLEAQRQIGLFSLAHLPMNLDYLLVHLPTPSAKFPYYKPDGLGLSIFITSPGLLYAVRAPWRDRRTWWLGLAALAVLIPSLLYYGGGTFQFGYRYALDSIPFVWALCGLAAVRGSREGGGIGLIWRAAIVFGVLIGLIGVVFAYHG